MTESGRFTLDELAMLIEQRALAPVDRSYTRTLLDGGMTRISKKLGEEAIETIIAALAGNKGEIVAEAADLLYHLLVMLHASGVSLSAVVDELGRRTRQSGLEEKAARSTSG